jgi:large repetitive protein
MRKRSTLGLSSRFRRRGMRTAAAAGAVTVIAALAAGCGGGGSSSNAAAASATTTTTASSTTTAGGQTAAEKALFTYAACMRGKGVNIPDPVRGADGRYAFPQIPAKVVNAPGVRVKAQACAAKLPQGSFRRGGTQSPAQRAAFQKFSACMRANGVTFGRPGGQQGRPPAGQGQGAPNGQRRGVPIVPGQPQGTRPGQGQGQGPGGFFNSTDPKVKAALAKCRKLLPAGAGP